MSTNRRGDGKMKKAKFWIAAVAVLNLSVGFPVTLFADTVKYEVSSQAELTETILNAIKNRETSFNVQYQGETSDIMAIVREARNAAFTKDTYEQGNVVQISGFSVDKKNMEADILFDSFIYYTTKEQEQIVNEKVQELIHNLITDKMDQAEKEKAIYDYIISNISYDTTYENYTAYDALTKGKTVCNGYVQLAYKLWQAAGIETKIVRGTLTLNGDTRNHAWNMVKIDGKWYHVDVTLDASLSNSDIKSKTKYYNLSDTEIASTHHTEEIDLPLSNIKDTYLFTEAKVFAKYMNQAVDKKHVFKLVFNQEIDLTTVSKDSIQVVDANGSRVDGVSFAKGEKGNTLLVYAPAAGYQSGKRYSIYLLKDIGAHSKQKLKNAAKISFIVK